MSTPAARWQEAASRAAVNFRAGVLPPSDIGTRHTTALRPKRWQRLYFRLLGIWPQSYGSARLEAAELDRREALLMRALR
jgi:hypothetical protein